MKTVCLTGGIGTGKSTVAAMLHERFGVPVVDADRASREVTAPGSPVLARIVEAFGPGVLAPDGSLDRAALRARVEADAEARRRLESITHPAIRAWMAQRLQELAGQHEVAVVEIPLAVETGAWRQHDLLLVVTAPEPLQVARLRARTGWPEERARRWIANQLPLEQKVRLADVVIRNDGDLAALGRAVEEAWGEVRRRLGLD